MIFGKVAILFSLLSVIAFSVLVIIFTLSIFVNKRMNLLNQYSVLPRRGILWIIAFSPWLVGLLAAKLTMLSASQYSPFPGSFDLLHWHHAQAFAFNSWHGLLIVFAVSYVSIHLARKFFRLILSSRQVTLLHALAEQDKEGFYQLDADVATAFTAGYARPHCYITSGLRRHLNNHEYAILRLHEEEHARRFDPLKKWFFQLLTTFFPQDVSRKLNQSMSLVMEQCADEAISKVVDDKSMIALTLLKVKRLAGKSIVDVSDNDTYCYFGVNSIEERITYLLKGQKKKIFPYLPIIIAVSSMTFVCAVSADFFHHLIEDTFYH